MRRGSEEEVGRPSHSLRHRSKCDSIRPTDRYRRPKLLYCAPRQVAKRPLLLPELPFEFMRISACTDFCTSLQRRVDSSRVGGCEIRWRMYRRPIRN